MKANTATRPFLGVALVAAITLLCIYSMPKDIMSSTNGPSTTNEDVKVDFDFTRMNPTMQMTYTYRLGASPKEFEGKTLRISGTFLTRVDKEDGKRYFGCLMGNQGDVRAARLAAYWSFCQKIHMSGRRTSHP